MTGVGVARQVTCGDEELSPQDWSHAGHRLDDGGLRMGVEGVADLPVELLEPVPERTPPRRCGHDRSHSRPGPAHHPPRPGHCGQHHRRPRPTGPGPGRIIRDGPNRTYYLKKRAEGHQHISAVIALARRRVDVLWALLRDNRPFTTAPPPQAQTNTAA